MESIQLKVISDGSAVGTKVVDQDGKTLDNVIKVQFGIDMTDVPTVTLTLVGVPVEIAYKAKSTQLSELEEELDFTSVTEQSVADLELK